MVLGVVGVVTSDVEWRWQSDLFLVSRRSSPAVMNRSRQPSSDT
jgi:hypothetical protein